MKRASLSQAGASSAPPRWRGWLAATATGWPSRRASAVTTPMPKVAAQLEHAAAASMTVSMMARGSYSALRFSGSARRSDSASPPGGASAGSAPWK